MERDFFNLFKNSEYIDDLLSDLKTLYFVKETKDNGHLIKEQHLQLHSKISRILFKAMDDGDFATMKAILHHMYIDKMSLFSEDGYNPIEYLIINQNFELLKELYINHYSTIFEYFSFDQIAKLFQTALNTKNIDILEFFLERDELTLFIGKESIAPCLHFALQNNANNLILLLINKKHLEGNIDGRSVSALLTYSIFHNQSLIIEKIFNFQVLIEKINKSDFRNLISFITLNNDFRTLRMIIKNNHTIKFLENTNEKVIKILLKVAVSNQDHETISVFAYNPKIAEKVRTILRLKKEDASKAIPRLLANDFVL